MSPTAEQSPNKGKATLLVVDDQEQNLEFFQLALEPDYRVLLASSSQQACELASLWLPDLILLDVMMPVQDGFATARALSLIPGVAKVPLIFLSALSDERTRDFGLELGAVNFLTKPIRLAQLREALAKVLFDSKQPEA